MAATAAGLASSWCRPTIGLGAGHASSRHQGVPEARRGVDGISRPRGAAPPLRHSPDGDRGTPKAFLSLTVWIAWNKAFWYR
jgi:hypothetical protein